MQRDAALDRGALGHSALRVPARGAVAAVRNARRALLRRHAGSQRAPSRSSISSCCRSDAAVRWSAARICSSSGPALRGVSSRSRATPTRCRIPMTQQHVADTLGVVARPYQPHAWGGSCASKRGPVERAGVRDHRTEIAWPSSPAMREGESRRCVRCFRPRIQPPEADRKRLSASYRACRASAPRERGRSGSGSSPCRRSRS